MSRARMAFLTLASTVLFTGGCLHNPCCEPDVCAADHGCSWFSKFRLTSRTNGHVPCDCEGGGVPVGPVFPGAPGSGPIVVPPNGMVPPPGSMPGPGQPPRIVPVPQANPMPYTPQ